MAIAAPTLIRRLPQSFGNPTGLERFIPGLGFASEPLRRYTALSVNGAAGSPVMGVLNLGRVGRGEVLAPATSAAAPTLGMEGTIPYLRFDGVDDRMYRGVTGEAFPTGTAVTTYAVVRLRSLPTTNAALFGWGEATNTGVRVGSSGQISGHRGVQLGTTLTMPTTGFHVLVFVANAASSVIRLDDTDYTGNFGDNPITTGMPLGLGGGFPAMDVFEVGEFSSTLNATQRPQLVATLRSIYGL